MGLAPFQPADAERFFGREDLVGGLVRRLEQHQFVAVFGASGAGEVVPGAGRSAAALDGRRRARGWS
jgi:hypothetical protein